MFEARAQEGIDAGAAGHVPCRQAAPHVKKPVCIVLHQENSNPGHVGQWFVRNGYKLDIRKPRFGDPLPETLADHCGAVIFGGPMSANDKDEFIAAEIEWIAVALKEEKPFFGICLGAQMLANHLGAKVGFHADEIGRDRLLPAADHGRGPRASGHSPITSTSGTARASSWRAARGCLRRPRAPSPIRPSPTAPPSACSSTPRSPTPRCIAGPATVRGACGMKGARERHEHIQGHIDHAPKVQAWLDRFLGPLGQGRTNDRLTRLLANRKGCRL